jgi:hypothetical protein
MCGKLTVVQDYSVLHRKLFPNFFLLTMISDPKKRGAEMCGKLTVVQDYSVLQSKLFPKFFLLTMISDPKEAGAEMCVAN